MRKILPWFCLLLLLLCRVSAQAARSSRGSQVSDSSSWESEERKVTQLLAQGAASPGAERVFYQIFPGSFSDSDGDGIGDLRGILRRFDYLNDGNPGSKTSLGIQGLWLNPVFASPSYHKYDVTDYYAIDPDFGTMEDLQELIGLCRERDVLLILDLPLNHTSREHPWFQRFAAARAAGDEEDPFYNWYLCYPKDDLPSGHTCHPLEGTDFCYEGNFSSGMPELNFDQEPVRQEALNIAKFYLDLGVDGFRFDAAKYIYFGDHARSAAFWQWYTGELRSLKADIWLVAEVWESDPAVEPYLSAMNCFNFTMASAEGRIASAAAGGSATRYTAYVENYLQTLKEINPGAFPVPFLSNHDMDRAAGFLPDSNGRARVAANLYLLGPGAPFIYYGEEIGLRGSRGGAETDANRRLAMRWGDGDTVRDPVGADYTKQTEATVASQLAQENSLLHYYRRLIAIRRAWPEIARGTYQALPLEDTKLGGFIATWEGRSVLILHNTTGKPLTLELKDPLLAGFRTVGTYIGLGTAALEGDTLTLGGQTSVLLE